MDSPVIRQKRGLSPVWILPLVALSIGGWLLYTSYRDAGIAIDIHFDNAEGITPGKTQVMYKGVAVGLVEQITVDEDLLGVTLRVKMEKKTKRGLVEDTRFWVVKPEISAGRISGLETLLSGSYIAVQPGTSSVQTRYYEGLEEPPILPPDSPGLHITLRSEALYSLQKGSAVYAKNLKIGQIKGYQLAEDDSILIDIYIEPQFSHLIKVGTRFWNASGISFEGNLQSGFSLRMQSMAALVYGGIACGTPETLVESSPQAANGMVFQLFANYESAEYGLPMSLQLSSGGGIVEGKTRVMYRGLEAGVVKKVRLNNDANNTVTAEILLDPRAEPILKEGSRFWLIRPQVSLDGIRNLDTIIAGPYITFKPGSGAFQDHFVVEEGPMPKPPRQPGTMFTLVSRDSGSLEIGAPLLYKKIIVGEIRDISLAEDADTIRTEVLVYDQFSQLVREDTVFWNVSGIEVDASLSRVTVNLSSIKTMMAGGIAFLNPPGKETGGVAAEPGASFPLFETFSQATEKVPALRPPGLIIRLESTADSTFDIGSPVLYKQIRVGEILGLSLSDDLQRIIFDVLIDEQYEDLINTRSLFYNSSGLSINADLTGVEIQSGPVAAILTGGISILTSGGGKPVEHNHIFPLYQDRESADNRDNIVLTLHLDRADGIRKNTRLTYQGIRIGSVRKVEFAAGMQGVLAEAMVRQDAADLFRDTTRLWLVKPEIGFSGVRHLDTLLTGPYIDISPGTGPLRTDFTLLPDQPGAGSYAGLNIILETPRLGSLNKNSPVYYRQVLVGRVTGFELSPTAQAVWVRVNIHPAYTGLVHTGTRFWLASGIRASWGLFSGLDVSTESMETILGGGIAFATPDGEKMGLPVENGHHFSLHDQSEKSWLDWSPEIVLNGETFSREAAADPDAPTETAAGEQ